MQKKNGRISQIRGWGSGSLFFDPPSSHKDWRKPGSFGFPLEWHLQRNRRVHHRGCLLACCFGAFVFVFYGKLRLHSQHHETKRTRTRAPIQRQSIFTFEFRRAACCAETCTQRFGGALEGGGKEIRLNDAAGRATSPGSRSACSSRSGAVQAGRRRSARRRSAARECRPA